jgi:hypothetical protein
MGCQTRLSAPSALSVMCVVIRDPRSFIDGTMTLLLCDRIVSCTRSIAYTGHAVMARATAGCASTFRRVLNCVCHRIGVHAHNRGLAPNIGAALHTTAQLELRTTNSSSIARRRQTPSPYYD